MVQKFKIRIAVFVVLFIPVINGFAFQTEDDDKKKVYHPNAVELVIQGSIHDLKGEYNKALTAYTEALIKP